jgi:hypothetical protein
VEKHIHQPVSSSQDCREDLMARSLKWRTTFTSTPRSSLQKTIRLSQKLATPKCVRPDGWLCSGNASTCLTFWRSGDDCDAVLLAVLRGTAKQKV